jgi:hypothetical protein
MFSHLSSEQWVRKDHQLRAVRVMTDEILEAMSPLFDTMYAEGGRPSIPPEKLLRAQLLQMLYSVRSERHTATSVPVPMAIPISACASAGASFTLSPAIATTESFYWRSFTTSAFF